MIFDGTTGGANFSARLLDQHAAVIVAKDMPLEPVQPAITLERIPPAHALLDSIDTVHSSFAVSFQLTS